MISVRFVLGSSKRLECQGTKLSGVERRFLTDHIWVDGERKWCKKTNNKYPKSRYAWGNIIFGMGGELKEKRLKTRSGSARRKVSCPESFVMAVDSKDLSVWEKNVLLEG